MDTILAIFDIRPLFTYYNRAPDVWRELAKTETILAKIVRPRRAEQFLNTEARWWLLGIGVEVQCGLLVAERVLFAPQFEQKRWHL